MLNIDVKFSGNTKERIEALINGFDKKRGVLMGKIAKRMEVDLRNKFLSNGGRSFWQDAASSIFKSNTDTKASVVVNKPGVALQYYGGTVRPKKARNLAIPMREEFRGKNPRELTGKRLFVFGQHTVCAVLRALGSGRGPLLITAFSAVLNIVLDLLFVGLWNLGTAGAAWATVLAQGTACVTALFFLRKARKEEHGLFFAVNLRCGMTVLRTALPASAQMVAVNMAFLGSGLIKYKR